MTEKELLKQVTLAKEELLKLRFQSATGQLEHPHKIRALKKEIARMLTTINAKKLGIETKATKKADKKGAVDGK